MRSGPRKRPAGRLRQLRNRGKARTGARPKALREVQGEVYPKPGPVGGRLIREVIALLRGHNEKLPVDSHILIATSSGADSLALAHLLIHYGRRVVDRSRVALVHVNHGWRGRESDLDEKFVRDAGRRWGVPVIVRRLKSPRKAEPQGWEDLARTARKKIFLEEAGKRQALVLTAHHADDLAETVLWRLLTGSHESHGGGIAVRHGVELRPLLRIRKTELKQYLKEEGESWREDRTNEDPRFLRARVRRELMPRIERIFPKAVERLVGFGLNAQLSITKDALTKGTLNESRHDEAQSLETLFSASGLRLRRSHWEQIDRLKKGPKKGGAARTDLPGGWRLSRDASGERWVLEKQSAPDGQNVGRPKM